MAFRASLELNNKEFDVLYSNYEFSRNTDPKGMPSSSVLGGRVKATIESTEDTSVIEAMLNSPFKPVEGKIIYKKTEEDAKMKEIQAVNACRRDAVAKGMKLDEAIAKWQSMDQLPAEYRS